MKDRSRHGASHPIGGLGLGRSPRIGQHAPCFSCWAGALGEGRIMRYVGCVLMAIACVVAMLAAPAEARRAALVIGNGAYAHATVLPNPANDAVAVAAALRRLGFEHVTLLKDLGAEALRRALMEFEPKVADADIALVYFAGHGIEVDGQNFLVPVDARLARVGAVELEAIPLSTVTAVLAGALKLRMVILDACRSNPFRARLAADASGGRKRSVGRGLSRIEPGENELIAFAAAAGTEADDGSGHNSPFAAALLKHIETPGLEVRLLFGGVRDDVLAATRRQQTPHVYATLGREPIYLKAPPATAPADGLADLVAAIASMNDRARLEAFTRHRSEAVRAAAARRLGDLTVPTPVPAMKPPVVEPAASVFNPARAARPLSVAEERALKAKDSFKECDHCPEMVVVPAGSFMMGSPAGEAGGSA